MEPTTTKGKATVQRVLDAACVLFARQGIRATTLNQVGKASATGRGQLYLYFADKADLVAAVVGQQVDRVLAAQQPLLGSIGNAADVRQWCALAAEQYTADDPVRCPIGSLVYELGEDDPLARTALTAGLARWRAALSSGLRRVGERGELAPSITPDDAATTLLAAYQGGVLLAAATNDVTVLRQALTTIASCLLPPPPPTSTPPAGAA
ncbi:TetR/AcrR family transcriptional regulator [Micromonospora endolithica]|uniref:TetR/AcrR family transcriptional regulator n=1 Tax=Micromonospora endolithica TaxID=230091 RepID=A0A3A9YQH2_9ACTN|nr:TetR/AcrR family transcriptional regulator [Micromonospora endolithica]RKN38242.1 TetR/AcrR family transcriptional regulator [Micromonospora endolithica]